MLQSEEEGLDILVLGVVHVPNVGRRVRGLGHVILKVDCKQFKNLSYMSMNTELGCSQDF